MDQTSSQQIREFKVSAWKYFDKVYFVYIFLAVCIGALVTFTVPPLVFHMSGLVLFVSGIFYVVAYSKAKAAFMSEFASLIGFSYSPRIDISSVRGKLFSVGYSQKITNVLSGNYKNIPIRIFMYETTVGSGKNSHTYEFTICEATYDSDLPDIKLHAKSFLQNIDWLEFSLDDRSVVLEGDFNKYFSLRVPQGTEVEAYQIFTPDIMEILIEKARGLNFEFCDNHVYTYVPKIISNSKDMLSLLNLVEYLDTVLGKNVSGMKTG